MQFEVLYYDLMLHFHLLAQKLVHELEQELRMFRPHLLTQGLAQGLAQKLARELVSGLAQE